MKQASKPAIAVTMGDPAGIGPEICLKAVQDPRVLDLCRPVIFGDAEILTTVADTCSIPMPGQEFINSIRTCDAGSIEPGRVQAACGTAAYSYIEAAVSATMTGSTSAIATAPIHKEALKLAGIEEPGHTEILARLSSTDHVCMMMASDRIIVALATIHISIADVPSELTADNIRRALELTIQTLHTLGKPNPRITVCGLNPHAGESGIFGSEEEYIIKPAIIAADKRGAEVTGPIPPDTAFVSGVLDKTDAYIVMYHDQGLIPFKMLSFETGVNITQGLPFVRTSVDHGTAFDIARQNTASPESMIQSILWAVRLGAGSTASTQL